VFATKVPNITTVIKSQFKIKALYNYHIYGHYIYIMLAITLHNLIRWDVLMVRALDSGSSGPGLSPGQGHCVAFLGKTLDSPSAFLHPGV